MGRVEGADTPGREGSHAADHPPEQKAARSWNISLIPRNSEKVLLARAPIVRWLASFFLWKRTLFHQRLRNG